MHHKPIPRVEWTRYLPGGDHSNVPANVLMLDELTVNALQNAEVTTLGAIRDLLHDAEVPDAKLPDGIGKRRVKEIALAYVAYMSEQDAPETDPKADELLAEALAVIAKRCGPAAMFESYLRIPHNGRVVMRLRIGVPNARSAVRKLRADDTHFHLCPARRTGDVDTFGEVLD